MRVFLCQQERDAHLLQPRRNLVCHLFPFRFQSNQSRQDKATIYQDHARTFATQSSVRTDNFQTLEVQKKQRRFGIKQATTRARLQGDSELPPPATNVQAS